MQFYLNAKTGAVNNKGLLSCHMWQRRACRKCISGAAPTRTASGEARVYSAIMDPHPVSESTTQNNYYGTCLLFERRKQFYDAITHYALHKAGHYRYYCVLGNGNTNIINLITNISGKKKLYFLTDAVFHRSFVTPFHRERLFYVSIVIKMRRCTVFSIK